MGHRVGMTTDETTRKKHWETEYPNMTDWQIISTHTTKTAAQNAETAKAAAHGCDSGPGGDGPEIATWKVYHFNF